MMFKLFLMYCCYIKKNNIQTAMNYGEFERYILLNHKVSLIDNQSTLGPNYPRIGSEW